VADAVFLYSDKVLGYDFGPQHPLQPIRYKLTHDLLAAYGMFDKGCADLIAPPKADDRTIQLVHDPAYIEAVKLLGERAGGRSAYQFGLGPGDNPIFPGMHDATAFVVGGSVEAARLILSGQARIAFNVAGGLHHALPKKASGFCIYNDPAIAIAWLLANGVERVAYLDTDAHHGDGVQWIFYEDPRVLTFSVHESGHYLFPGTGNVDEIGAGPGRGTAANIPLHPSASDADFLFAIEEAALPLVQRFRPDVLVVQHGCDGHRLDPLTHLQCSVNVYAEIAQRERALADEICGGRIVATGGGGYAYREVVPRAWTAVFATLAHIELPDQLPESWRAALGFQTPPTLSDTQPGSQEPLYSTKQTVRELQRILGW
jgi:acetoin utilization protein AcuC